jgi:anti-sigma regulatory factor (Ser/Thr protein kinase)
MTQKPTLHIVIPPDARHARAVRDALIAFTMLHGVVTEDVDALLSAVGEAIANAIEHGVPDGDIDVTVEIDTRLVSARVIDNGRGFLDTPTEVAPLPDPFSERGRGIAIMQRTVDLWDVESMPGRGTTVTLGRYRRGGERHDQERAGIV